MVWGKLLLLFIMMHLSFIARGTKRLFL